MSNIRIIGTNVLDTATVLTSTTAVSTLPITNTKTDIKSEVWRSTSLAELITLNWATGVSIQGVALAFTNLTATATIRVRCYAEVADSSAFYETGTVLACPGSTAAWANQGVAYGGGSYVTAWFPAAVVVKKVRIDVVDSANPAGYIEVGKLIVGPYFSPVNNSQYGSVKVSTNDASSTERSDAGDLRVDRSFMYKAATLDLAMMPPADRDAIWQIFRRNGVHKPVFVSISPETDDAAEEQSSMLYGRMSKSSEIQYQYLGRYASVISVEEV